MYTYYHSRLLASIRKAFGHCALGLLPSTWLIYVFSTVFRSSLLEGIKFKTTATGGRRRVVCQSLLGAVSTMHRIGAFDRTNGYFHRCLCLWIASITSRWAEIAGISNRGCCGYKCEYLYCVVSPLQGSGEHYR